MRPSAHLVSRDTPADEDEAEAASLDNDGTAVEDGMVSATASLPPLHTLFVLTSAARRKPPGLNENNDLGWPAFVPAAPGEHLDTTRSEIVTGRSCSHMLSP